MTREILLLTPCAGGNDGISEVSRQIADALAAGDAQIEVWALDGPSPDVGRSARVPFRSAHGSRARLAAWVVTRARRSCDDLMVVVLHVHLAPLALALTVRGARLACFFHGIEVWQRLRSRERKAIERASVVIANSQYTVDRFRAANPDCMDTDVVVCHLGIPFMAAATLPPASGYALLVGRMAAAERYKGHDVLLRVWSDVLREVPSARLVFVGDGDDRGRLETLANQLGVSEGVTFAGRATDSELAGYYQECAFFVMPSCDEGFGLVFLEAMRAGKACIAGAGAAAEILDDGITGLIVDPADRSSVTRAVVELFRDARRRDAMGQAGALRAHSQFNRERFASRIKACVEMASAIA